MNRPKVVVLSVASLERIPRSGLGGLVRAGAGLLPDAARIPGLPAARENPLPGRRAGPGGSGLRCSFKTIKR